LDIESPFPSYRLTKRDHPRDLAAHREDQRKQAVVDRCEGDPPRFKVGFARVLEDDRSFPVEPFDEYEIDSVLGEAPIM
jgi:hypothetical protein